MTLNQLRVFRAIASTRNIATAAKSLFMTPSSVGMQLKALEKDLRVPLYERRKGQINLTEAGMILLRYAETILTAEDEAIKEIAGLRGTLRGRLRFGTNITGGMYVTPPMIREFRSAYPEIEVSLVIDTSPRIMDSILQGIVDAAIIGGPVDGGRFEIVKVGYDELIPIASPSHRLASEANVNLESLSAESLILPGLGSRSRWLLEAMLREQDFHARIALTMNGTEEVKKAVEANLGVGFVSRYAIERELRDGTLVSLQIDGFRVKRDFEMIWLKGHSLPTTAAPMIGIARRYLESLSGLHLDIGPEPG
ncbi:MAG TPA: LysR substrate-binding domain-containing protein [Dehalococcoidia bacterium]|nr:LysR substrate-binding domain-containing protein [Dehalococcoidia bacterium]